MFLASAEKKVKFLKQGENLYFGQYSGNKGKIILQESNTE